MVGSSWNISKVGDSTSFKTTGYVKYKTMTTISKRAIMIITMGKVVTRMRTEKRVMEMIMTVLKARCS